MRTFLALLFTCLGLLLLAAGCGGGDDEDETEGGAQQEAPQPAPTGGTSVTMNENLFAPKSVTVKRGDTVKWTNDDPVGHDVTQTSGPGRKFKSGPAGGLNQDDTFTHTFTTTGRFGYVCTVHAGMEGTVVVR
jgi:plastocyanin